jgi:hypothetical protein
MKSFTIDAENNITIHGSAKEAETVPNSERFSNEGALAKLAANWPAARLVEIWNSLPGEAQVRKFKDRATAVSRIWKAIQTLGQTGPVATQEAVPEQQASEAARPEAAISEVTEPAPATNVAPQSPDVASSEPAAKKRRPPSLRRRPPRQPRRILVRPAKGARPAN